MAKFCKYHTKFQFSNTSNQKSCDNPSTQMVNESGLTWLKKILVLSLSAAQISMKTLVQHPFTLIDRWGFNHYSSSYNKKKNHTKKQVNHPGHSSQYDLGSISKVLKNSSNFHHFLVSLREVNPENFMSLALTVYFLETFKVFQIPQSFCILRFLLILEAWIIKMTFLNALNLLYS